uniref:Uncharacterized protein n=1 Tax=Avena sativa TaxID=4498 RepID=A0ACD5XQ02_AVESA
MAADEADGDRFIEMVSAGALYHGGVRWERKYWSCSRGKDRYPYPVGYHAVRHFAGISYAMEIQEGPRGPLFQVTSTKGDSATGQTPDIAWKNLHKKTGAKVRDWQREGSFPQKIDGVELFGFKNASVQRLLRQLLVDSTGFGIDMSSPNISGAASQSTDKVATDVSDDYEEQHVCLDKTDGTAKRFMNPVQEEAIAKRAHYQDMVTSVHNCNDESNKSAQQSSNKGGLGSNAQLWDSSTSICMPLLLEKVPFDSKCTLVNDSLGDYAPSSSQEDGLSSSSYLGSEKSDLDLAEKEVARNLHIWMMVTGWSAISEEYVISSLGNVGPSILELRKIPKSSSLIIGHDGAGGFCLWDISKRTLLSTFAAPGNIVFQILPVGLCSLQEDIVHASVNDIERRLREITVSDKSAKDDKESILMLSGKDIAVWIMVSSASVAEYQHDLRAKEHNARWRLALLANKKVFMGNIFDPRATSVDATGNYGFAGTYEGLLYMWELSSGRKLTSTQCFNSVRVSRVAVDAKSSVVAVADNGCELLLYTQTRV